MTVAAATSGGSFRTELPAMEAAARHVLEVNEQIQSQLASLLHRLDPLMSTWQGPAATSFHALKDRWHTNAVKLNEALRAIGDGLVQSQRNYESSEDVSQQTFTGLAGNAG